MDFTFDIFVDSAANLTDEMKAQTGIKVIPYICTVDGKPMPCYEEGVKFSETAKFFYDKMAAGAEIKTSLIGEDRIIEAVTPSMEQGKDVLLITIATGISGTHAQALQAQKTLGEKYKNCKLYVADSANASLGEGLLAVNAAALRDLGESAKTCCEWVEENKYRMNSYLTVDDLKYLRRGGRISTTLAIAGTLLNIKPIIRADGGSPAKLAFFGKERGRKKSLEKLAEHFAQNVSSPESQTVAITHTNCEEDALKLAEMVKALGAKDVVIEYYDVCTGSHVGPGTVALFFMGNDRRGSAAPKESILKRVKTAIQKA